MSAVLPPPVRPFERKLPPVVGLSMVALALAVIGGIVISARIGEKMSLVLPIALAVAAGVLELAAIVIMARIRPFAWDRFLLVGKWALLAYVIQAGIIEYAFVRNHTPGGTVAVLTFLLVIFATSVPLMIAFTVARYQAVAQR
ncbi:MAG: hypothetical protein U0V73_15455 [Acidimicrobiia bacterium]